MKRCIALGAAFGGMLCALPGVAEAQVGPDRGRNVSVMERSRPDYAPLGLRMGAIEAFPSLATEVSTTDNLFAEETNEESDVILALRPRLDARTTWSRHGLRLAAGLDRTMHVDFPKDDTFDGFADIEGRLDLGRSVELSAGARYADRSEARQTPDQPQGALSPVEFEEREVYVTGAYAINRVRLSGRLSRTTFDFSDVPARAGGLIDQDDRDREVLAGVARVEYAVSPSLSLLGQVELDERDYDLAAPAVAVERDSIGQNYLVGASFDVSRLMRGEIAVGYLQQDFKDPSLGQADGLAASARLEWFPQEITTVAFTARRTVEETGFVGAASFLLSEVGARIDHELRRNVIVSVGGALGAREFQGLDRDDDVARVELEALYLLNRRVALRAGYRHDRVESAGLDRDRDFTVNRLSAGLTLQF